MTREELDYAMRFNVSAIFTFMNKNRFTFVKVMEDFKDVYSLNMEDLDPATGVFIEDYLYFVFKYSETTDYIITDELSYIEKIYVSDYIILKIDKWLYMTKSEWQLMKESSYYDFDGIISNESKFNRGYNIQFYIITKNPGLSKLISDYIGLDITKENIFWKAFNIEEETLDLSKITDMTVLGYKKAWLIEEMEKSNSIEREVYHKILKHSFEVEVPKITSLKVGTNLSEMYLNIRKFLFETCGVYQFKIDIKGTKYSFLPNEKDFIERISKVIKKYNLEDIPRIERCLKSHIKKLKAPILKYYILKDNVSALVDDYENFIDEMEETPNKQIKTSEQF